MPRIARGLADGLIFHVLNRGNNKQKVFHKDQDYVAFLKAVTEVKYKYPIAILAYCLMPNHFHFVLVPHQADYLSKFMQLLMTKHVRRYHQHYETSGHIWQGRYKSFIIQEDEHLITILRYVESNPVRAGLVSTAKDWKWSNHRERLSINAVKIIDNPPLELPRDWAKFVDGPITVQELKKIHRSLNRQSPFGDDEWQIKISRALGLQHTINPRGRPRKKSIVDF